MKVSQTDYEWLKANYPQLHIDDKNATLSLEGTFSFLAAFDEINNNYIINPKETHCLGLVCINDSYNIKISLQEKNQLKVWETSGRLISLANKYSLELSDLHVYDDGEVCLTGPLDNYQNMTLREFIEGPLIQFFYDESYFKKYGRWPRGEYSHGIWGLFENFNNCFSKANDKIVLECLKRIFHYSNYEKFAELVISKNRIQGHIKCPCGSNRKFKDCHYDTFRGMGSLQRYIMANPQILSKFYDGFKKAK